jgi:hypothetical protein
VLLAWLGFQTLATTSSGFAATLGRADGQVTREEAIGHAAEIVQATDLPVSADLENGFADDPEGVAETVRLATGAGLAGCSVEDFTGHQNAPIYDPSLAAARIEAAAEAAHRGPARLVLTARAENHLHGRPDLADTIGRLQAYQEAGADVLYAPGLTSLEDIRRLVAAVDRPVNVLARPGFRRWPNSPRSGSGGSRSAVGSPSPPSGRWSRRQGSCARTAPTTSGTGPVSAPRPPAPPSQPHRPKVAAGKRLTNIERQGRAGGHPRAASYRSPWHGKIDPSR